MRLCPTVDGSSSPLITHQISVDQCMARQRSFYHKCHRCQFRGKPANWEPEPPATMMNVHAAEEPVSAQVTPARLPKVASKPRSKPKNPRKAAPVRHAED